MALSRYEAAELAAIERRLNAAYPSLDAALRFPADAPEQTRAAVPDRPAWWRRLEWAVPWIAGVVATGLLAMVVMLVPAGPGHCSVDAGSPAATPVAPSAAAACTSAQWRAQGVSSDPHDGPAALHHSP